MEQFAFEFARAAAIGGAAMLLAVAAIVELHDRTLRFAERKFAELNGQVRNHAEASK